jgi:GT2 family glycosyltransferase
MQHLVSIIMPAYNAGKYLAESIGSVLSQTHAGWELIVINDGSSDNTGEVTQSLATADKRIRYFAQPNGGQAAARNKGLREARGDLVAFLDADDLWLPQKLESQLTVLEAMNVDLVYSGGYIFSEDTTECSAGQFSIIPGETQGSEMFHLLFGFNSIATLTVLVRRESLDAVGLFDENRAYQNCEDYDLWMRLAQNGAIFFGMREKLVRYRRHPTASTITTSKVLRPMLRVILKHADHPSLDPVIVKLRIRSLYRDLISSLVAEGQVHEARKCMREFCNWDRGAFVTKVQQILLRSFPHQYNYISRECLYRVEWHLRNLLLGRGRDLGHQPRIYTDAN